MAELADALDLGSSAARRAGSSPVPGTKKLRRILGLGRRLEMKRSGTDSITNPMAASDRLLLLHLLQALINRQPGDY